MTVRGAGETGSVLVEALVAVLIIAAMSGLWFETLARGARAGRSADDRRLAMLVAQSQLATVGVVSAIAPGTTSGSDAGLDWRIAVSRAGDAGAGVQRVGVDVTGPQGDVLARLQTLRIGQ